MDLDPFFRPTRFPGPGHTAGVFYLLVAIAAALLLPPAMRAAPPEGRKVRVAAAAGQWVRLEVPACAMALEGTWFPR